MKTSIILTLLNEEKSIDKLLLSLIGQTKKPDEIVVVDGYSTDSTFEILKKYSEKFDYIKVIQKRGNISVGRNEAINKAKSEIIAQTDAGCIADKNWLSRITEPFTDRDVGFVAGFYDMVANSNFQKALAPFLGVTQRRFDPNTFMPSGRSVAFRKSAWKEVGGYDENLTLAGEDTMFNYKLIKAGIRLKRVPSAYVYWQVPANFKSALKKFFNYARGDGQNNIWWHPVQKIFTHNIKILSIYLRYLLLFLLAFGGIFYPKYFGLMVLYIIMYSFWSIWKHTEDVPSLPARAWIPLIQFSSDLAVMAGFIVGVAEKRH